MTSNWTIVFAAADELTNANAAIAAIARNDDIPEMHFMGDPLRQEKWNELKNRFPV